MDKCKDCGMPMKDGESCKCAPELCYHCCKCDEKCECGCKGKTEVNPQ